MQACFLLLPCKAHLARLVLSDCLLNAWPTLHRRPQLLFRRSLVYLTGRVSPPAAFHLLAGATGKRSASLADFLGRQYLGAACYAGAASRPPVIARQASLPLSLSLSRAATCAGKIIATTCCLVTLKNRRLVLLAQTSPD